MKNIIESAIAKKPVDFKELIGEALKAKVDEAIGAYIDVVAEGVLSGGEQLDEVSKERLKSYVKKADKDRDHHDAEARDWHVRYRQIQRHAGPGVDKSGEGEAKSNAEYHREKSRSRISGMNRAHDKLTNSNVKVPASKKLTKEDEDISDILDQLDEVSKTRLAHYITKAASDNSYRGTELGQARAKSDGSGKSYQHQSNLISKMNKRQNGINTAARKLATEDEEFDLEAFLESLSEEELTAILEGLQSIDTEGLSEEEIAEVSKERLGKYIKAAAKDNEYNARDRVRYINKDGPDYDRALKASKKRDKGIDHAIKKLTK